MQIPKRIVDRDVERAERHERGQVRHGLSIRQRIGRTGLISQWPLDKIPADFHRVTLRRMAGENSREPDREIAHPFRARRHGQRRWPDPRHTERSLAPALRAVSAPVLHLHLHAQALDARHRLGSELQRHPERDRQNINSRSGDADVGWLGGGHGAHLGGTGPERNQSGASPKRITEPVFSARSPPTRCDCGSTRNSRPRRDTI